VKLVIFGTGNYYKQYKKYFSKDEILYLVDNDEQKQGTMLDGKIIYEKHQINYSLCDYIIILIKQYKEIRQQLLNMEIGGSNPKKSGNVGNGISKIKDMFKSDFSKSLDMIERNMIRFASGVLILTIVYIGFSVFLVSQINKKESEVQTFISESNQEIGNISNNTKLINERTNQYDKMIEKINEANDKITQSYARKNALPNLLTEIMFNIPKEVQLISINNTTGKSIKIEAKSKEYEQLGYFIAKIKNEGILTDVTSTSGVKQDDFVLVTIEGNLPY